MSKDLIAELEKRHKIDLEMSSEIIKELKEEKEKLLENNVRLRQEKIRLNNIIDKAIKIIENDTDLNSNRQRERLISILKGVDKE